MFDLIRHCTGTGTGNVFRGVFDDELIVTLDEQAKHSMIEIYSFACAVIRRTDVL